MNGEPFRIDVAPFSAPLNTDLRWVISEGSHRMLHPVRIRSCQIRILNLNGTAPPAHTAGWKDTAPVAKGDRCEIRIRFERPVWKEAPFAAYCHILEHEESGMMTNLTIA